MCLVLQALKSAGIEVVVLKGTVLAERLYGEPSLRFSFDLDLLIWPRDLKTVSELLELLGYRSQGGPAGRYERAHTHQLLFGHTEFPPVEIHFHLLVDFGMTIPAAAFVARAIPYKTRDGTSCRVLVLEDEVFYLLLHAVHHEFARFCWVHDVWTLLQLNPDLEWDEVFRRAEQENVREPILYAMELLRRRFGLACRLPCRMLGRRARQALASLLLRVYDTFAPLRPLGTLFNLFFKASLCDRLSASVRFLRHNLWRMTRRRLHRWLPQVVPEDWSG